MNTIQLARNSQTPDDWRSMLSGISTLCVDLWGTVARSDNREPILDAQRILGYKTESIDPKDLRSVDPAFLNVCLTTDVRDAVGFLRSVASRFDLPVNHDQVEQFQEVVDHEASCSGVFFDAKNALKGLKARGFQMSLVSNLWSFPVDCLFAEDNLGKYFPAEWRIYSFEEGVSKPDPEIYRRAYMRCRTSPENCLMIGDHLENDILPALAVGMKACLVDRNRKYDLTQIPDGVLVVKSMEELLSLLPEAPAGTY
jgi:FMN phosphatase YigB (HAD superfamily)